MKMQIQPTNTEEERGKTTRRAERDERMGRGNWVEKKTSRAAKS
jgi:hypothetical protein